jgi:hypothetical protein
MRQIILMIVTAPIFWIFIGLYELLFLLCEGLEYWKDLIFDPDEDEEEIAKEK